MGIYDAIHDSAEAERRGVYDHALAEKDAHIADLDGDISELNAEAVQLTADISRETVRADLAESANTQLRSDLTAATTARDTALTEATALRLSNAELNDLVVSLRARIAELEAGTPDPASTYDQRDYDSLAAFLDDNPHIPRDANFVTYRPGIDPADMELWSAKLPADAVLVYPRGVKSIQFSSAKGFTATSDAVSMEYISDADFTTKGLVPATNPNATPKPYSDKYVTGWTEVKQNPRTWFAMCRVPRGIICLDKDARIEPTDSGYKGQRQPKGSMGTKSATGTLANKVGVQQHLIEHQHHSPIFANFTLGSRNFGTIAYLGLIATGKVQGATVGKASVTRVTLDKCWSGFAGIPNGEAGAIGVGGLYDIRDIRILTDPDHASSPIMWNNSPGGTATNILIDKHWIGMVTFWHCSGVHTFKNFTTNAGTVGINLEENTNFELNWSGGGMTTDATATTKHVNLINAAGASGSAKVHFTDFSATLNSGYAPGKLTIHRTGPTGVQKKSDITWDGGDVAYVNSGWV